MSPAQTSSAASGAPVKPTAAKPKAAKPKAGAGGAAQLPAEIFDAKVNVPLIHQVVVAQEAAARQGTHSTKTRGEVRGGGRKPYRQKGTGRARQGSTRAPQFAGGGVVFGPHPRSYEQRTPKKMKAAALRGALSDRARHDRVHVVNGLVDGDAPRTKSALAALTAITGPTAHVLVVIAATDSLTRLSLRNAPGVHVLVEGQLNTRDVLVSDHVVFTQEALNGFVARTIGEPQPAEGSAATRTASRAKAKQEDEQQ
jgi:large subunit ribosomal protein L4